MALTPFDQSRVEAYKKNMFALLGKPGFEDFSKRIKRTSIIDMPHSQMEGAVFLCQYVLRIWKRTCDKGRFELT